MSTSPHQLRLIVPGKKSRAASAGWANGTGVVVVISPLDAVTAGGGAQTVFRKPRQCCRHRTGLHGVFDVSSSGMLKVALDLGVKFYRVLLIVGVGEGRAWAWCSTEVARQVRGDALGGRNRASPVPGALPPVFQHLLQPIVFRVADDGIVENAVAILVVFDHLAQLVDLLIGDLFSRARRR